MWKDFPDGASVRMRPRSPTTHAHAHQQDVERDGVGEGGVLPGPWTLEHQRRRQACKQNRRSFTHAEKQSRKNRKSGSCCQSSALEEQATIDDLILHLLQMRGGGVGHSEHGQRHSLCKQATGVIQTSTQIPRGGGAAINAPARLHLR